MAAILAVLMVLALAVPVMADKSGEPNGNASDQALGGVFGEVLSDTGSDPATNFGEEVSGAAGHNYGAPAVADEVHAIMDLLR